MQRPTPHKQARYWSPDEIAECFAVSEDLYRALWKLTTQYEKIDYENCGPSDCVGFNSVSSFWQFLTRDHCVEINAIMEKLENEIDEWEKQSTVGDF